MTTVQEARETAGQVAKRVFATRQQVPRHELPEVGYPSLSLAGVVAEACWTSFVVLLVGIGRAGITRLPTGGEFYYFPTSMGAVAMSMVLALAVYVGIAMFKAIGGGLCVFSTDLHVLRQDAELMSNRWALVLGVAGAMVLVRHVFSFVFAIFVWLLVGAEYNGYPASTGFSSVMIAHAGTNVWSFFRLFLTEFTVAFFFALALLMVVSRYSTDGKRVKFNNNPGLALAGIVFALSLAAAPICVPVLFPALETGPMVVHAWAKLYAASSTYKWTDMYPSTPCFDTAVLEVPLADTPHIHAEPWLSCYTALKANASETALTTWVRAYGDGRILPTVLADGVTAKLDVSFDEVAFFVAKILGPLLAQVAAWLVFLVVHWLFKDRPFGEGRTLGSVWRYVTRSGSRVAPTGCGGESVRY